MCEREYIWVVGVCGILRHAPVWQPQNAQCDGRVGVLGVSVCRDVGSSEPAFVSVIRTM